MILTILGFPMALFGLIFALFHASRRQRAVGREVIPPSQAVEKKDLSFVGIVEPADEPGVSPITGEPVVWSRAFKTFKGLFRSSGGSHSHTRRIGKVNTRFALVDETDPDKRIFVDSKRISETWILLPNRRYTLKGEPLSESNLSPGALQAIIALLKFHLIEGEGNEESCIRPGDRIRAHGKLRRCDGQLTLRGFSAWLDSREPADRVRNAMEYVKFGALAFGSGSVLVLFGWLIGVVT